MANLKANSIGRKGEALAVAYLKQKGYTILQTNYTCPMGELDIIATLQKKGLHKLQSFYKKQYKSQPTPQNFQIYQTYMSYKPEQILIVVEVKSRSATTYGLPQEAVTKQKQHKIKTCTHWYIAEHQAYNSQVRFDCIAVLGETLEHIENAFI